MVLIPEGKFTMGSDQDEPGERPAHLVYLDSYYIDRYEVTNAQFTDFLNAVGETTSDLGETLIDLHGRDVWIRRWGSTFELTLQEYANHPVIQVSWYGARSYCEWASMRLPTEAEWEKAARGSDGRTYPWGEDLPADRANYGFDGIYGDIGGVKPVASYPHGASPYGVHDMAGNVWEWVWDWWDRTYYTRSQLRNPQGPEVGANKVLRGGSWMLPKRYLRSSFRFGLVPTGTLRYVGFRCARSF